LWIQGNDLNASLHSQSHFVSLLKMTLEDTSQSKVLTDFCRLTVSFFAELGPNLHDIKQHHHHFESFQLICGLMGLWQLLHTL
jgi:hypothetical protein